MMNVLDFKKYKLAEKKISMVTAYDYSFAKIISNTDIDCLLVGDSLAMVMHGYESTVNATIDLMKIHTSAVKRGAGDKFIIADLPFLSYRSGLESCMNDVLTLMQAGANALKLEGVKGHGDIISHIVDSGVPVMGHLGLTPQSVNSLGGYRVQGKTDETFDQIVTDALTLQELGVFAIVLECVSSRLAEKITKEINIPTIGIGAGPFVDGQVLVLQDLLGMNMDFSPRFVRSYLDGEKSIMESLNQFNREVKEVSFPTIKESYQ